MCRTVSGMDDLEQLLRDGLARLRGRLEAEPAELMRRLNRRRQPTLSKVPRAWCLAVRANDTRIDDGFAQPWDHFERKLQSARDGRVRPARRSAPVDHEVRLRTDFLRLLCKPVMIDPPGQTLAEVAAKLGTTRGGLLDARINGTFRVRHINGLGGARGLVPLLYTDKPLDPSIHGFCAADELWGWTSAWRGDRVPEGIDQSVRRVGRWQDATRLYRDKDNLHPEHPDVDGGGRRRRRRLPPPQPDYVWYKFKNGQYVGYDWRNAAAAAAHEKRVRKLARIREQNARRKPRRGASAGSLHFAGWKWLCPTCGRRCDVIYYPLKWQMLLADWDKWLADRAAGLGWTQERPGGFACYKCHRVRSLSRVAKDFWNDLVSYLSGGLLYGSEVKRPPSLQKQRKRAYRPRPNGQTPWRREQVKERLLLGCSYKRIATELGIHWHTVDCHARKIYAQHGARGRYELAKKLGAPLEKPLTKREQVEPLFILGLTYRQIGAALGMKKNEVAAYVSQIRRRRKVCEQETAACAAG